MNRAKVSNEGLVVRILFAIMLSLACFSSVVASETEETVVIEALQLIGMERHFNELHQMLVRGLNQRRLEGVDSGSIGYDALESLIDNHFEPQQLTRQLAKLLVEHYDVNRFELLLSSLRSEQIQAVRSRIEHASAAENLEELKNYARGYNQAPLSQQKSYIIEGLDRASAGNELYAGVQALATLTMLRLQEVQQGIAPQFAEDLLLQQLYSDYLKSGRYTSEMIYRLALGEMSAEQLQLSLRVYRSTVVQWFLGAAVEYFTTVVTTQREHLLKVVDELKNPSET